MHVFLHELKSFLVVLSHANKQNCNLSFGLRKLTIQKKCEIWQKDCSKIYVLRNNFLVSNLWKKVVTDAETIKYKLCFVHAVRIRCLRNMWIRFKIYYTKCVQCYNRILPTFYSLQRRKTSTLEWAIKGLISHLDKQVHYVE